MPKEIPDAYTIEVRPRMLKHDLIAVANLLPISEMTYTVLHGTLNPSIPYHTIANLLVRYLCYLPNSKFVCVARWYSVLHVCN